MSTENWEACAGTGKDDAAATPCAEHSAGTPAGPAPCRRPSPRSPRPSVIRGPRRPPAPGGSPPPRPGPGRRPGGSGAATRPGCPHRSRTPTCSTARRARTEAPRGSAGRGRVPRSGRCDPSSTSRRRRSARGRAGRGSTPPRPARPRPVPRPRRLFLVLGVPRSGACHGPHARGTFGRSGQPLVAPTPWSPRQVGETGSGGVAGTAQHDVARGQAAADVVKFVRRPSPRAVEHHDALGGVEELQVLPAEQVAPPRQRGPVERQRRSGVTGLRVDGVPREPRRLREVRRAPVLRTEPERRTRGVPRQGDPAAVPALGGSERADPRRVLQDDTG